MVAGVRIGNMLSITCTKDIFYVLSLFQVDKLSLLENVGVFTTDYERK
jgi:hypothetical protein